MKTKICFLVNSYSEYTFKSLLDYFLPKENYEIDVLDHIPENPSDYRLIIPWSFRKIISNAAEFGNVFIVHSSNLPEGRGWAPLYYTIQQQQNEYIVCGILADDGIDTGAVVVRARTPLLDEYTATFLRRLDHQIIVVMIKRVIDLFPKGPILGVPQTGTPTYNKRRKPADSEVNSNMTLADITPHLRAVESHAPAFYRWKKTLYTITLEPLKRVRFPDDVLLEFPFLGIVENWSDWYITDDSA